MSPGLLHYSTLYLNIKSIKTHTDLAQTSSLVTYLQGSLLPRQSESSFKTDDDTRMEGGVVLVTEMAKKRQRLLAREIACLQTVAELYRN